MRVRSKMIKIDKGRLNGLMDRVEEIAKSPKNLEKKKLWKNTGDSATDHWRGMPERREKLPRTPITAEPETTLWGELLDFDTSSFYSDPVVYLEKFLEITIYRHEHFDEDTVVGNEIPIWLGVTLESSLFGAQTVYAKGSYPWIARDPVIRGEVDLAKLDTCDFRTSGLMPLAHTFYEVIGDLTRGRFKVVFPEWGRSPFGVATHIRGYENFLVDIIDNPSFAHRILSLITQARKRWTTERAGFLGKSVGKGNIYNDEVNCPSISPTMYEEFALPYEKELEEFHGGILYWHSCGNTTAMIPSLAQLKTLQMYHVGPWTDVEEAVRFFGNRVALEVCLHPVRDVQQASEQEMRQVLSRISRACGQTAFTVRADGLQKIYNLTNDVEMIQRWTRIAREVLG
jgi:uroporphyrinogen-III decarboxylase